MRRKDPRGWAISPSEMEASGYDRAPRPATPARERTPGGRAGNELGRYNEARLRAAVRALALPWVLDVRPATAHEDREGIDVVAQTDRGDVRLQSKSRRKDANRWRKRHAGSAVECVVMVADDALVAPRVLAALIRGYDRLARP